MLTGGGRWDQAYPPLIRHVSSSASTEWTQARSRETGGTGLGLSIVKHVVDNHAGQVTVQSTLGVGSTFTVTLPR